MTEVGSFNTVRLRLRPVRREDAARLFAIYGDPATQRFNPSGPLPDHEAANQLLQRWLSDWSDVGFGPWAVSERSDPETLIGFGGLSRLAYGDRLLPNLGYRFAVEAWGRGLATELAIAALRWAFDELGLAEVYGLVRPAHTASIRVLEKVGMTQVGTLDDAVPASLVYRVGRPP
ncbi:GNAT family N-acetyltransferase [Luteibacter yeojuensis]|uniref:GNAT family acetyltraansferase n=1 Tax=Luteibacter yeojuensis TaxID=345309 RepID=A0A0F3L3P0_9GAMM|nr:GNAT family N-acetyltransferase [Luteibacter yeojuensis]KJV36974.1 GNAT family acetyltraansferase [Luteibacter yeojuensis]